MDIGDADTGQWMTYSQLAAARDIGRDAARKLAQRHRWRRQAGNDGLARVLVPSDWLGDPEKGQDIARDTDPPRDPDVVPALQGAIETLRQQLTRADAREDVLRHELEQVRAEARDATEAARIATDALKAARQSEEARKARGRWARLRAAWRRE